jgi:hypothetical protein
MDLLTAGAGEEESGCGGEGAGRDKRVEGNSGDQDGDARGDEGDEGAGKKEIAGRAWSLRMWKRRP